MGERLSEEARTVGLSGEHGAGIGLERAVKGASSSGHKGETNAAAALGHKGETKGRLYPCSEELIQKMRPATLGFSKMRTQVRLFLNDIITWPEVLV
jgi:hypothetical protein